MARRYLLIFKLLIGFSLVLMAVSVWLFFSLEPSDIGSFLQSSLGRVLQRQVTVGQARFNFSQGLAFEVDNVTIGTLEDNRERLEVPALFVKPRLLPLLTGRLSFAKIICKSPLLFLDLRHKGEKKPSSPSVVSKNTFEFPFQTLDLSNGTLKIVDSSGTYLTSPVVLEDIQGRFRFTTKPSRTGFSLAGKLIQGANVCSWSFKGHMSTKTDSTGWWDNSIRFEGDLKKFSPAVLFKKSPLLATLQESTGSLQLHMEASGVPAQGLSVEAALQGVDLTLRPPGYKEKDMAINNVQFRTRWVHTPQRNTFESTTLDINEIPFTGKAQLERKENVSWMQAELSSPVFSISQLHTFLPGKTPFSKTSGWSRVIPQGSLQISSLAYDGPASRLFKFPENLPGINVRAKFSKGKLNIPGLKGMTDVRVEATLADNILTLANGYFSCLGAPTNFHGRIEKPLLKDRKVKFEALGTIPVQKIQGLTAASNTGKLRLEGLLPFRILAEDRQERLHLHLKADLSSFSASSGELVLKKAGEPGRLEASATTDFTTWSLLKADLSTGLVKLQTKGRGDLHKNRKFKIQMILSDLEMSQIPRTSKILNRLQLEGKISLVHEWAGEKGTILQRHGTLTLKDAGVHLTRMLADLKGLNGTVSFSENRAEFQNVSGRLGTSPVLVSGSVVNFKDPVIRLRVKSARIRADELIFHSDQSFLYDLDGTLTIDRNQILFDEVNTALKQGTVATVKGFVKNFQYPETRLFITSENAVIDEVITLWKKPPNWKEPPSPEKERPARLLIDVQAKKGSIGNFHFEKASGQIRLKNKVLVIHPLDFHSGPGYGVGQVLVDNKPDGPALLRISGHVEDFDAEAVSLKVIRRKSLVSGALRGDFYLEGRAGSTFLPTSRGVLNVELKEGVLKRFNALSKVFSILNVSQIFSLELPDMANEGMPFDSVKGAFKLRQGVLSSENLFVDSEAMKLSLVGNMDLHQDRINAILGVKPLGTVDKIITSIPVAGWLLAGEEKALIMAHFQLSGKAQDPDVRAIPVTSISKKAQGIFKRIFNLPGKMISDTEELFRKNKEP